MAVSFWTAYLWQHGNPTVCISLLLSVAKILCWLSKYMIRTAGLLLFYNAAQKAWFMKELGGDQFGPFYASKRVFSFRDVENDSAGAKCFSWKFFVCCFKFDQQNWFERPHGILCVYHDKRKTEKSTTSFLHWFRWLRKVTLGRNTEESVHSQMFCCYLTLNLMSVRSKTSVNVCLAPVMISWNRQNCSFLVLSETRYWRKLWERFYMY